MDIEIIKGKVPHLEDCYEALMNSDIGRAYFLSFDARIILREGLEKGEIDVALDTRNEFAGFIWYQRRGAFLTHTYLHIIAVKEEYRNRGIGKKLIANFEETTFKDDNMIFLMVADFNPRAQKLYSELGYTLVGSIPGFYKREVTEQLMMKVKAD